MADSQQERIESLIAATNDPTQRGTLVALSAINIGLTTGLQKNADTIAQTVSTLEGLQREFQEYRKESVAHRNLIDAHIQQEKGAFAGARWGQRIVMALGGIILSLVVYVVKLQIDAQNEEAVRVRNIAERQVNGLSRLDSLERRVESLDRAVIENRNVLDSLRWPIVTNRSKP